MKIAVCGKGGCGKSTTTALLGKELARKGKKVLIIDSDESNYGLHRQLGMELPGDFTEYFGGKSKAFKTMMSGEILQQMKLSAFAKKFFVENWTLADIPEEYYIEKDGVLLMASGKIHEANEGCACTMGSILKELLAHLELNQNEFAITDMEAGIEHFGRGVDNSADIILMIVDTSYESLRLSKKIYELGQSINKPVYFVLNKVAEGDAETMKEIICKDAEILCELPENRDIRKDGLQGKELTECYEGISELADKIISMKKS